MRKKILYIDLDNVVVDFMSGVMAIDGEIVKNYEGRFDEIPNVFSKMLPMDGAVEAIEQLAAHYEVYFLSTAPWKNPSAWSDKLEWVQKYFPVIGYKRLILTHNKQLNLGDYLIDDRLTNGAVEFTGELILFDAEIIDWNYVVEYLGAN